VTGSKKAGLQEEKKAAEILESIGVHYNVWPQAQSKPDGFKNIAVFDASRVKIIKVEEIEIELKGSKWVLKSRKVI
jgi:GH43 family beta-xylosidase